MRRDILRRRSVLINDITETSQKKKVQYIFFICSLLLLIARCSENRNALCHGFTDSHLYLHLPNQHIQLQHERPFIHTTAGDINRKLISSNLCSLQIEARTVQANWNCKPFSLLTGQWHANWHAQKQCSIN